MASILVPIETYFKLLQKDHNIIKIPYNLYLNTKFHYRQSLLDVLN